MAAILSPLMVAHVVLSFILFIFGCTTTALASIARHKLGLTRYSIMYGPPPEAPNALPPSALLELFPTAVHTGAEDAVLAAGIITIVAGAVSFCATFAWSQAVRSETLRGKMTRGLAGRLLASIASVAAFVSSLIALAYASAEVRGSSTWRYADPDSVGQEFTLESWTCQLSNPAIFGPYYAPQSAIFERGCKELRKARYMTIPLVVLSVVMVAVSLSKLIVARKELAQPLEKEQIEMGTQK